MARKPKTATVTIRMNRDGTYTFRSRNYDLRKLFPAGSPPAKPSTGDVNFETARNDRNDQSCCTNPIADAHSNISDDDSFGDNVTDEWLAAPLASNKNRGAP